MIKQPGMVRDRILSDVNYMLKALYSRLTLLPETENDVLNALEHQKALDIGVEITNLLMGKFGHPPAAETRFDKTRRASNKKQLKGPRGENTFNNSKARAKSLAKPKPIIPEVVST